MTNGTRPDPYRLIADALASGDPDPELLAAYAEDPASLDAAERTRIERALTADPGLAAELAVLRRFDASAVSGPVDARRTPAPRRRALRRTAIGAFLTAAAAALLVVYLADDRGANPEERARPSLPSQASADAAADRAPEVARNEVARDVEPLREAPAREETAQLDVVAPKSEAPRTAQTVRAPESAADSAAPPAVDEERLILAMATPTYARPPGERVVFRPVQVFRDQPRPRMVALAPEHVTWTSVASPELFWAISRVSEGEAIELEIAAIDQPPLYRAELPLPARAGVQRFELAELGVELPADVDLTWTVTLIRSRTEAAENPTAQGWLRRVTAPAALGRALEAAPLPQRPGLYAQAGYWHEALGAALALKDRYPQSPEAARVLESLIDQIGLEAERADPELGPMLFPSHAVLQKRD